MATIYNVNPKAKIKDIRQWISCKLVNLAKWIYPQSEAVKSFFTERIMDYMITGKYIEKVKWDEFYKKPTDGERDENTKK